MVLVLLSLVATSQPVPTPGRAILRARSTTMLAQADPLGITREGLLNALHQGRTPVQQCYTAVSESPGEVVVRFDVGPDGRVRGVPTVERSDFQDEAVEECIISVLRQLQFPVHDLATVPVRFAFRLQPWEPYPVPPAYERTPSVAQEEVEPAIQGHSDPSTSEWLYEGLRRSRVPVQQCYDSEVPEMEAGDVVVAFVVTQEGRVSELRVERNDFFDDKLSHCIVSVLQEVVFERPAEGGPVSVAFPFQLRPGELFPVPPMRVSSATAGAEENAEHDLEPSPTEAKNRDPGSNYVRDAVLFVAITVVLIGVPLVIELSQFRGPFGGVRSSY